MIDATGSLLAIVVIVLVIMLTVLGVQVFFILKEFRKTLEKANKVLDDTGVISESVSKPVSMMSTMLTGIKGGSAIMKILSGSKTKKEEGYGRR